MSSERVTHEFAPVYNENSRVLVLGTIPSPRSREQGFYYMHPQNHFWRVLSEVLGEPFPSDIPAKKEMCLRRGIALWDVLAECTIDGASDSSIKDPQPNPLGVIFYTANIRAVFTTGTKAHSLYERYFPGEMPDICLPSTSPANRTVTDKEITEAYRAIAKYL